MLQAHEFIECPGCKRKLPNSAQNCHFCGVSTKNVARVAAPDKKHYAEFETPKWITGLYYGLCAWWVIGGLIQVVEVFAAASNRKPDLFGGGTGLQVYDYVGIAFGAVTLILGFCMFFKVEAARNIVNIVAFLNIIFGLLGLITSLFSILLLGPLGVLLVISSIVDIVVAGLTIWLLSETGKVW